MADRTTVASRIATQIVGMVLAQLGIGPAEASARMRALAFVERQMLLDVAHDVVERRSVFTEGMR